MTDLGRELPQRYAGVNVRFERSTAQAARLLSARSGHGCSALIYTRSPPMRRFSKADVWLKDAYGRPQRHRVTDGGSASGDRKLKECTLRFARDRPQPSAVGFDD
jgi:hypothetical protein